MSSPATLVQMEAELVSVIQQLTTFRQKAFSIYSLEDLERLSAEMAGKLPIVGVGYDGCAPEGNQGTSAGAYASSVAFVEVQFLVVLAVQYSSAGQSDTKQSAMSLLHEIRTKLIGYKKVNTRPWRFGGERPEPSASGDGVIFYSQVWLTSVPFSGSFTTQT